MILPEIFRIIWHRQEAAKNEYNAGKQLLVSLEKDEVASVEYWLYLEGCDEQCTNPVQDKKF